MGDTNIQWTDAVWNCVRGCSRVSRGCGDSTGGGCYAERQAIRFAYKGGPYEGLVKSTSHGPRWTGKVQLVESMLDLPLRWRKPRRIFVNSMSDLFHENLPDEAIFRVFMVMQAAKAHTFQVLTKRPERMRDFARKWKSGDLPMPTFGDGDNPRLDQREWTWPLPNVWLGVSVEDQATADARIPVLLDTPAAVRWVSYEPALGPVDFTNGKANRWSMPTARDAHGRGIEWTDPGECYLPLDWIVVGGESGPGARPFDLAWARETVRACKAAGVPVFVKQLGARLTGDWGPGKLPQMAAHPARRNEWVLRDPKGGDPAEWPAVLAVREYPTKEAPRA